VSSRTLADTARPSSSPTTARAREAASGASSKIARCSTPTWSPADITPGNPSTYRVSRRVARAHVGHRADIGRRRDGGSDDQLLDVSANVGMAKGLPPMVPERCDALHRAMRPASSAVVVDGEHGPAAGILAGAPLVEARDRWPVQR
jgi:hypothetical protein